MPLDMFQGTQSDTDAYVARNNAPRLPATFADTFGAAWAENRFFGQSIAHLNARGAALNDYTDDITRRTGERFDDLPDDVPPSTRLAMINDKVTKLSATHPDIAPISDEELDKRAVEKSRQARADFAEMQAREKTGGGSFGSFLGGAAGTLTDPVNLVVAPIAAPEGLGLLGTALAWGAIGGGTQAAIEVAGQPYRDMVQPGYSQSAEPVHNILGAAAFGAGTGGTLKALGMAWTRYKTGTWPRSIRDAGNVAESEANVASTNVLPGLEGEVAHREALAKSIDDVVAGRKVEVPDAVTAPQEPRPGFDVYHGSPHDFDRFSMEKIGTGEGAQSYGHGLYFAENRSVAADYQKKLSPKSTDEALAMQLSENLGRPWSDLGGYEKQSLIEKVQADPNLSKELGGQAALKQQGGNVYQVRINADREHFIDFDKPLSEQSEHVKAALAKLGITDGSLPGERIMGKVIDEFTTRETAGIAKENATRIVKEAGIPGIKYLDQGSRAGGEGSRNFVLFDDKLAQITHKNGEPLSLFDQHEARVDMMMDERAGARGAAAAEAAKPAEPAPQLPLEPTAPELHEAAIADGVQNIARMTGYDMSREEAAKIAQMVAKASTDEQARAILSAVADRPQTVADFPPSPLPRPVQSSYKEEMAAWRAKMDQIEERKMEVSQRIISAKEEAGGGMASYKDPRVQSVLEEQKKLTDEWYAHMDKQPQWRADDPVAAIDPKRVDQMATSPDFEKALRADIDRARAEGDVKIPAGVDEKGDPIFRSADAALDEVDAYKAMAQQIQACAAPQPAEAA